MADTPPTATSEKASFLRLFSCSFRNAVDFPWKRSQFNMAGFPGAGSIVKPFKFLEGS